MAAILDHFFEADAKKMAFAGLFVYGGSSK